MSLSSNPLFDSLALGSTVLRNRIVMAPMTRSRADDAGVPGALAPLYYGQRASAGLIITEGTFPSPMGKGYVRTPGIHSEAQVEAWHRVTDTVHAAGGTIFMQIMHAGRISDPSFLPDGATPVAPSAVRPEGQSYTDAGMQPHVTPRALDLAEIPGLIEEYQSATRNALRAGFDGVELHAASGYLPEQFLSSKTNRRDDAYGGDIGRRARFVLELLEAMAGVAGAGRVGIKLSPEMNFNDIADDTPRETYTHLVEQLAGLGLAYLHVALFGTPVDYHGLLRPLFPGPYLVGGGLTQATATALLNEGKADAAVFGSLFIANPDLPERFRSGAALAEPDRSTFYTPGGQGYTDYPTLAA
ncbi:alkene reductase [Methylomagnum ishizawai]|uniref:alkene reductase n=1 Tax=Methylomagnum ishizawai TaxID=1760988 RepID=UPI001C32F907|nr:alkene reductase [Methylomagnum ishizawai]BBL73039.1 alkene reductase [Methylomagnum ishizawai]